MTPDEFRETILPQIVTAWDEHCLCANPGFQKLISFDFRNYGIGPAALADSEILIHEIIRRRFIQQDEPRSHQCQITQSYICPQCQAICTETYEEFSISMNRSFVNYDRDRNEARNGLYLVGMRGFSRSDFDKVGDFKRARTQSAFMRQFQGP